MPPTTSSLAPPSRSSPPRARDRAPGSASRWRMASLSNQAGVWKSIAKWGAATTIRMLFPKLTGDEPAAPSAKMPGYQASPIENLTAPPLILVVDDSCEIADLARDTLTGHRLPRRGG